MTTENRPKIVLPVREGFILPDGNYSGKIVAVRFEVRGLDRYEYLELDVVVDGQPYEPGETPPTLKISFPAKFGVNTRLGAMVERFGGTVRPNLDLHELFFDRQVTFATRLETTDRGRFVRIQEATFAPYA